MLKKVYASIFYSYLLKNSRVRRKLPCKISLCTQSKLLVDIFAKIESQRLLYIGQIHCRQLFKSYSTLRHVIYKQNINHVQNSKDNFFARLFYR